MPSPFPGMDPWLEDEETFPDLHEKLLVYLGDALNAVLPPGYRARTRTRVWVDDEVRREPDVSVLGGPRGAVGSGVAVLPGLVAVAEARRDDPTEEPYLEILSPRGRRLVTAVEVLSRTNKRAGRRAYREKQAEFRLGGVNLVEIDLLRGGPHVTVVPADELRQRVGAFDYHVSVCVAGEPDFTHGAGIRLADRLPAFGIPLDPGVAPVVVDLQPLLDRAYDTGRYAGDLDYRRDPDPPLTPEQRAWADAILKEKGLLP